MLDFSFVYETQFENKVLGSSLAMKFGSHSPHSLDDAHFQAMVHLAFDIHHVKYLLALRHPSSDTLSHHSVGFQ